MSKWDKLLARICFLSKDLRFDELRRVLERTPERQQPLHHPQGRLLSHYDPEA